MKVVAILQARVNSTRLPGKMLLPLLGKPLVQHVIERVQRAKRIDEVVLAFPAHDHDSFYPIVRTVGTMGYTDFIGDENDLVGRYLHAAEMYRADIIVRIPCDNPCVDPKYIDEAVAKYLDRSYTFYSNTTSSVSLPDKKPTKYDSGKSAKWVDGVGCEVFSLSRLKWLDQKTQGHSELREHPHKYYLHLSQTYWDHEDDGGAYFEQYNYSDVRLDVNTQQEYECIKDIYAHFGHNRFTTFDIINYLTTKEASHESIQREQPSGNSQQRA